MDFDYVVAPSLILLVVVLVSGFCLYRARMLHIKRYGKWRRNTERIVLSLVILVAVAVCGSSIFNALAVHHCRAMNPPPGNLYAVNGHKMHLYCTGDGSPTIILDAGLENDSLIWGKVQPELSRTSRKIGRGFRGQY